LARTLVLAWAALASAGCASTVPRTPAPDVGSQAEGTEVAAVPRDSTPSTPFTGAGGDSTRAPIAVLRVAVPRDAERHPMLRCARVTTVAPVYYRTDDTSRVTRLVRTGGDPTWPETLIVFPLAPDDAEIALERGEVDVAVFWPGDLSTRMRESPRWRDPLMGTIERGVVAVFWGAGSSRGGEAPAGAFAQGVLRQPWVDLTAFNRRFFRGDLAPVPRDSTDVDFSTIVESGPRFHVSNAWPAHEAIERALNAGVPADAPALRLVLSPSSAMFPRVIAPYGAPLFTLRCAVVCDPALRAAVAPLADALANLRVCEPATAAGMPARPSR
jgi:hypothetical protein